MTNHSFKVGDLVILQHPIYYHEYDGSPGLIVGGYREREGPVLSTMTWKKRWTYSVRILVTDCLESGEPIVLVEPHQIRKPGEATLEEEERETRVPAENGV